MRIEENILFLIFQGVLHIAKIKVFASSSSEDVKNILNMKHLQNFLNDKWQRNCYQASGFEVRSGIIGLRDEELILRSIIVGFVDITDLKEFLFDGTQQIESWLYLTFRLVCFN